jgi:hypothetical protein
MDPFFFVFAWLAYVAAVWSTLLFDRRPRKARNAAGKFLRRLYARGPRFAAPQ